MARTNHVKRARKDQGRCMKCTKPIKRGDPYKWFKPRYSVRRVACASCSFSEADKCTAKYQPVLAAMEEAEETLSTDFSVDEMCLATEALEAVAESAREIADEYRDSVSNMPESLQDGEMANNLNEYADELESYADSLESFSPDEFEGDSNDDDAVDEWREQIRSEATDVLSEFPYPSF